MKKINLIVLLLSLAFAKVQAQESVKETTIASEAHSFSNFKINQVSVGLGINGIMTELSKQVGSKSLLNLHTSYRFYKMDFRRKWGNIPYLNNPHIETAIVGLSYDYFIFKEKDDSRAFLKHLKIKGGVQYLFNNKNKFRSSLESDVELGQWLFTTDQVGEVNTTIAFNKMQPFVATGYDRFFKGDKYSFSADLGVLYQGKAKVDVVGTYLLESTASQAATIEKNLRGYQLFPYVSLKLNVKM